MINREAWEYLSKENNNKIFDLINNQSYIFLLIWFLMWFAISYYLSKNEVYYVIIVILIIVILTYFFIKFMIKWNITNTRIKNNTKGIKWEKEVAYELDLLRSKYSNFYVINDFQKIGLWNIDHIIISEKWIFTIETKNINYVSKEITLKGWRQSRREWIYLQKLLSDKFWIKFVQPLLIYVGEKSNSCNTIEKIISISDIEDTINTNSKNLKITITNIKEIYLFLTQEQQKFV